MDVLNIIYRSDNISAGEYVDKFIINIFNKLIMIIIIHILLYIHKEKS